MADRVAAVEQQAASELLIRILTDDANLHHQVLGNLPGRGNAIRHSTFSILYSPFAHPPDSLVLDHLGASVGQNLRRQRLEERRIDDHQLRRMEGAREVLALGQIAARLAAGRRVHHGEKRRREVNPVDATHPGCRGKTGEIARHAAAERRHHILAAKTGRGKRVPKTDYRLRRLVLLARRNDGKRRLSDHLIARLAIEGCNVSVRDKGNPFQQDRSESGRDDHQRLVRRLKRVGDTIRKRIVVRRTLLGLVAKRTTSRLGADAAGQFLLIRRLETKDRTRGLSELTVRFAQQRAAAERNDRVPLGLVNHRGQRLRLDIAKDGFAVLGEDLGNRTPLTSDNLRIKVDERRSQTRSQFLAERRLAGRRRTIKEHLLCHKC